MVILETKRRLPTKKFGSNGLDVWLFCHACIPPILTRRDSFRHLATLSLSVNSISLLSSGRRLRLDVGLVCHVSLHPYYMSRLADCRSVCVTCPFAAKILVVGFWTEDPAFFNHQQDYVGFVNVVCCLFQGAFWLCAAWCVRVTSLLLALYQTVP